MACFAARKKQRPSVLANWGPFLLRRNSTAKTVVEHSTHDTYKPEGLQACTTFSGEAELVTKPFSWLDRNCFRSLQGG